MQRFLFGIHYTISKTLGISVRNVMYTNVYSEGRRTFISIFQVGANRIQTAVPAAQQSQVIIQGMVLPEEYNLYLIVQNKHLKNSV